MSFHEKAPFFQFDCFCEIFGKDFLRKLILTTLSNRTEGKNFWYFRPPGQEKYSCPSGTRARIVFLPWWSRNRGQEYFSFDHQGKNTILALVPLGQEYFSCPGGQFFVKLFQLSCLLLKVIRILLVTNHLGKNKIIAPKELNSCPRGFAAWARMISYGAIILFLPSWLVTNSISLFLCLSTRNTKLNLMKAIHSYLSLSSQRIVYVCS